MYLLGDGQAQAAPLAVTGLAVGCYGVVYHCLDTLLTEMGLQLITAGTAQGEDVPHTVVAALGGQHYMAVVDMALIVVGDILAPLVLLIYIL